MKPSRTVGKGRGAQLIRPYKNEIADLRRSLSDSVDHASNGWERAHAAESALSIALKERDEAREDAERYRWLRGRFHKNNRWPYVDQHRFMPNIDDPSTKVPQLWDDSFPHKYHPENLDAAIDAAREQTAVPQSSRRTTTRLLGCLRRR